MKCKSLSLSNHSLTYCRSIVSETKKKNRGGGARGDEFAGGCALLFAVWLHSIETELNVFYRVDDKSVIQRRRRRTLKMGWFTDPIL